MYKTISQYRNLISIVMPLALFGILILLTSFFLSSNSNTLALAITIDLLVTVPLIYFMLIRKSTIPGTTVIPMMLLGLVIGSYILPSDQQAYLDMFKNWALPVIELSILTIVVIQVRKAIHSYRDERKSTPDFYDALKSVSKKLLPGRLAMAFATEIAVLYYGFINWKKPIGANEFTYHKNSGTQGLMAGFVFIIGIETFVLHHLLMDWSLLAAWICTGLSIYTAFQVIGFARAMSKRLISIEDEQLILRYSIMSEAIIPLAEIESVEKSSKSLDKDGLTHSLSPLGELESHNVVITVKEQQILHGFYGIKKSFKTLTLHVDSPDEFVNLIDDLKI